MAKPKPNLYSDKECDECGDLILKARLILLPHTNTCVECQESREKKGLFQRHRMDVKFTFKCDEIEATEETLVRGTG